MQRHLQLLDVVQVADGAAEEGTVGRGKRLCLLGVGAGHSCAFDSMSMAMAVASAGDVLWRLRGREEGLNDTGVRFWFRHISQAIQFHNHRCTC